MKFKTDEGMLDMQLKQLTIAGWTGRDRKSVDLHIQELKELGVTEPSQVPMFYNASVSLICQKESIQVLGPETSGEVEPMIIMNNGILWLGLASDHTDRELESHSVVHSKQCCAKPVAGVLWKMDSLMGNLDNLRLCSWIKQEGSYEPYQDGTLGEILPLSELVEKHGMSEGSVMLCGTLKAIGGIKPAKNYRMALIDPTNNRQIDLEYSVEVLQITA